MYVWSQDRPSPNVGLKNGFIFGHQKELKKKLNHFVQAECGTDIYIVTVPIVVS